MIKMEDKYKIIVSYIQDLSVEIPSPESLLTIRNTIPEFQVKVDISSKPLKKKDDRSSDYIELHQPK